MQKARKNKSPFATGAPAFEPLESRQMMSVTIAPSGGNDTAAIQNALNSTPAGQTVNLTAGTYHVSSTLNMNGHILAGVKGQTTLQWAGGSNSFMVASGSNSELEGVTVTGAGIQLSESSSNVIITNDTIENVGGTGIDCQGGSDNLQITHNTLQSIGGYGMVLYSINQAHVDYNTITNIYEGIHAVNFLGNNAGNNCTFNYNTVTGITRHGIEIQNNWTDLSVGWNYVADFNVQPGGNSHFALSIATGPGAGGAVAQNVDVHDNVLLGNGPGVPSNPNYCFTAIEIMGNASVVNHNFIANWGWSVLDGWDSNWQVTNNTLEGVTSMNGKDALPENQGVAPSVDSGNTFVSSWNGQVPSAFANAGANATGTSGSATTPVAAIVAAPINLTATSPSSSEIGLSWQDQSGGKAAYTVQIKSTYGSDPYVAVASLPAGSTGYNITGLNPNWWYNITVTATQNGQNSLAAVVQQEVMPPGTVSSTPSGTNVSASNGSGKSASTTGTGTTAKDKTVASGSKTSPAPVSTTTKQTTTKTSKKTVSTTPPPLAVAAAPGHGLVATFSKGHGKNKTQTSEVTADVNYEFNGKSKTVPALTSPVGKTNYSVAWTGEIEAPTSGKYRIVGKGGDGMRVTVDGKKVSSSAGSRAIKLVAGEKYDIKVQYTQKTGPAKAQLMWAAKGTAREVIPDEDLYLPQAA